MRKSKSMLWQHDSNKTASGKPGAVQNAAGPYPQDALGSGSWELEEERLRALREKIRTGKKTLKEIYGSPLRGIVTGLNAAFVIDTPTKEKLCAQDPKSADLLKPLLKGNELTRWRVESQGNWIIYIPKNRIRIDNYPAIRDWLLPFKEKLEARATKQEWFELQQAQEAYLEHFEDKKIIYPDLSQGPKFSLDEAVTILSNTAYFIPIKELYFLSFLNSKAVWFFLKGIAGAMRGGEWRLRLFSHYIEEIPFIDLSNRSREKLSRLGGSIQKTIYKRLELQNALIRRIPDLCPPGQEPNLTKRLREWWNLPDLASFRAEVKRAFTADIPLAERSEWEEWITRDRAEIARLTDEIRRAEAEIDRIVYDLFELTSDEVTLLENSINRTDLGM